MHILLVGCAPELLNDMKDVTIVAPTAGVMTCELKRGDPKADITWYKDNKQVYDGKKAEISFKDNKGSEHVTGNTI